jgi:pimeloyl-ACP methyl ester carboxylesterase
MEEHSQPKVKLVKSKSNVGPYEVFEFYVDSSPGRDKRHVDVLLVHGLIGDPIKSWGGSLDRDNTVSACWPSRLAIDKQSEATFWTLGYPAPLFDKELNRIQSAITEEGKAALVELARAGLGEKPIIFVTHSLGGLLAKAILAESAKCESHSPERQILESTRAVIFAGTPHAGSLQAKWRFLIPFVVHLVTKGLSALVVALATLAAAVGLPVLSVSVFGLTWQATLGGLLATVASVILGVWLGSRLAPGRHVLMLDPNNPSLRTLTLDFQGVRSKHTFFTDSFFEQKALWGLFLVVPWWSANPDCSLTGILADHISMCKDPYARPLQHRVAERVESACSGKTIPVFGKRLKPLLKDDDEFASAFAVLFADTPGDRGKAEKTFRTFLREKMGRAEFVPASTELDLALRSRFDGDKLVSDLWYEQTLAEELRDLRKKAKKELENGFRSASGSAGLTLIPFHRSLRTIEHICAGDLPAPGFSNNSDRDLLLGLIDDAREKIDNLCPEQKRSRPDGTGEEYLFDTGGSTRRLLLRMSCMLQAAEVVQEYVGKGKMAQQGKELAAVLAQLQTAFDDALAEFRTKLSPRTVPPASLTSVKSETKSA